MCDSTMADDRNILAPVITPRFSSISPSLEGPGHLHRLLRWPWAGPGPDRCLIDSGIRGFSISGKPYHICGLVITSLLWYLAKSGWDGLYIQRTVLLSRKRPLKWRHRCIQQDMVNMFGVALCLFQAMENGFGLRPHLLPIIGRALLPAPNTRSAVPIPVWGCLRNSVVLSTVCGVTSVSEGSNFKMHFGVGHGTWSSPNIDLPKMDVPDV